MLLKKIELHVSIWDTMSVFWLNEKVSLKLCNRFSYIYFCFMCVEVYLCIKHRPSTHGSQKSVLYSLELKVQMMCSTFWVLEVEPGLSVRVASVILNWWAIPPAPYVIFVSSFHSYVQIHTYICVYIYEDACKVLIR